MENWDENSKCKHKFKILYHNHPFTLLLLQKFQIFEQRWIEETKPKLQVFKQKEEQVLLQRILRNRSSLFPSSSLLNIKSLSFGDKKYAVRKNLKNPLYTNNNQPMRQKVQSVQWPFKKWFSLRDSYHEKSDMFQTYQKRK